MQAANTVCTYAPPYHQRCWLLNWMLITHWKVSLLFSPRTRRLWFPTRMSNLDSSDHRTLFHFETVHFKWASGPCSHMASFLHDRALVGICRWHGGLFTDSGFWKYSWAHLVISMTESCRWVMQCRLRARRPRASTKVFGLSLTHRDSIFWWCYAL